MCIILNPRNINYYSFHTVILSTFRLLNAVIIHLGIAVQMIPYDKSLNIEWLGPGTFRQHALQKGCVHHGPSSGAQTRHALSSHPSQDQHARLLSH